MKKITIILLATMMAFTNVWAAKKDKELTKEDCIQLLTKELKIVALAKHAQQASQKKVPKHDDTALDLDSVHEILDEVDSETSKLQKRVKETIQRNGFTSVALNEEVLKNHIPDYTHALPRGSVQNQNNSGRCWIFACLSMIRTTLASNGLAPPDFAFSQSYLYFFMQLERAFEYLKDAEYGVVKGWERETFLSLAHPGKYMADGGLFQFFTYIVKKYGIIPQEIMPDTITAKSTGILNDDLTKKLVNITERMQKVTKGKAFDQLTENQVEEVRKIRNQGLKEVVMILETHLGQPPKEFNWEIPDQQAMEKTTLEQKKLSAAVNPKVLNQIMAQVQELEGELEKINQLSEEELQNPQVKQAIEQITQAKAQLEKQLEELDALAEHADELYAPQLSYSDRKTVKITPKQFAGMVGFNPDDYVVVSANNKLKKGHYNLDFSPKIPEAKGMNEGEIKLNFVNVDKDRLKELVKKSINAGFAVPLSADVNQDFYIEPMKVPGVPGHAIFHPDIFEKDSTYGFESDEQSLKLDVETQKYFRMTFGNHAMLLTAYDQPAESDDVIKFLIENSWGMHVGDFGHIHMYREWFEKHVFDILIHKSLLTKEELESLESEAQVIGPGAYY